MTNKMHLIISFGCMQSKWLETSRFLIENESLDLLVVSMKIVKWAKKIIKLKWKISRKKVTAYVEGNEEAKEWRQGDEIILNVFFRNLAHEKAINTRISISSAAQKKADEKYADTRTHTSKAIKIRQHDRKVNIKQRKQSAERAAIFFIFAHHNKTVRFSLSLLSSSLI